MDGPRRLRAAWCEWPSKLGAVLGVILIIKVAIEHCIAMHFYHKLNLIVAGAALLGHGAEGAVDLGWYPPKATQINNLTNVLTATGVYGFIYNSSYPTDAGYGYNWYDLEM